ncbi:DUF935 domain-containing protein [Dethiosulfatarculus sandiegensis]|uniref:Portal protein n=1 Tax=Dethiosulfatarculus sandiegensis TaxID=1429043 RepID=A0A0D2HX93_9BACT|nr:DUF935 family protein [Dethiosulfatarculus sandiegensis]KIX14973.1 hypothetical protein X474_05660 [Dethiosulfatarculus sandiegensis]
MHLYGPDGSPIEFSDHKDLLVELASPDLVGGTDQALLLPDPDPILLKRGDDPKVLEDLSADDQVCAVIQNRKLRVLNNNDYDFKPGLLPGKAATSQAKSLCEDLTKDLEGIALRDVFSEILDAPLFGTTWLELIWRIEGGKYRLKNIIAKPRSWFCFNEARVPCLKPSGGGEATPLPWGKAVLARHFPSYKNPYGLRLLSRCLWPVAFKRGGIQFYTRFLDRYGQPWVLGKAPKGANKTDKQQMAADLAAMVRDAVAVIPSDAQVELVEAKGNSGDQFDTFLSRWDKAISKVIMGQTLTSEMDGQGSRAASETHYKVADDIADSDQGLITAALNAIARVYRDINSSAIEAPVFGYSEPEDHEAQAKLDNKLYSCGVRFTAAHFERRYGLQPDEFVVVGIDADGKDDKQAGFAEPETATDHQDLLDDLVKSILPKAAKQNEKFLNDLFPLLDKAETWEDIQLLLAEHLGQDLAMEEQEELLADLMTAADLMGRTAVRAESDAD